MSTVILAEKPSQAKAFAAPFESKKGKGYIEVQKCSTFPQGAKITWCVGHLVELKSPEEYNEAWKKWDLASLPIVPDTFQYKVKANTSDVYKDVKTLLQEAFEIVIACDPDREGENIARSVIELSGNSSKPMKRLWINSLEADEVKKGFENLKDAGPYFYLYQEAQARQISDWIVGMTGTRLYSVLIQKKGLQTKGAMSVGRVQTPSLKLIYDREQEIENFQSEPFFELNGEFKTDVGTYKGKVKRRYKTKKELQEQLDQKQIKEPVKGEITSLNKQLKKTKPPKLHSLSTLQTLANKKYKYSPSSVLKTVQSLYDNPLKLVSYPRTDTQHITESEFNYLKENVANYQAVVGVEFEPASLEPNKRFVDGSVVNEHYAIVPTRKKPTSQELASLSTEQKNIYFEIVNSALAMFHHDYEYEETTIVTTVNTIEFNTIGKVEKRKGWKALFPTTEKKEKKNESEAVTLPPVEKGMTPDAKVSISEGKTNPPKPYTEGQLINMMKTCGQQIDDEELKGTLKEVEGLGTEATRSNIIETLIRQQYIEIKKNIVSVTEKGKILCQAVEGTLLSKPEMTAKWEQFLKRIGQGEAEQQTFIDNTIKFTNLLVDTAKNDIETVDIKQAKANIDSENHIALCPKCQTGHIQDRKTFYGCTDYQKGCKQTFPKKFLEKNLTKPQVKALCEKGKTNVIKGFKSKKGKTFDAHIIYKEGAMQFEFPKK